MIPPGGITIDCTNMFKVSFMMCDYIFQTKCIVCHLIFCCKHCRWKHEQATHELPYDCPICRGNRFLCKPQELNKAFIHHLAKEHLPLQCRKCGKIFSKMEDLSDIDKCSTISELIDSNIEDNKKDENVDSKFDSLYEKVNSDMDNFEAIVAINNSTKTAVITPLLRKKRLVDYESSDAEWEDSPKINVVATPHPKLNGKTATKRAATPHVKKFLVKQKCVEIEDDVVDEKNVDDSPANSKTPLRNCKVESK